MGTLKWDTEMRQRDGDRGMGTLKWDSGMGTVKWDSGMGTHQNRTNQSGTHCAGNSGLGDTGLGHTGMGHARMGHTGLGPQAETHWDRTAGCDTPGWDIPVPGGFSRDVYHRGLSPWIKGGSELSPLCALVPWSSG